MRTVWDFIRDAGGWGLASSSAAAVSFAAGVWEHARGRPLTAFTLLLLGVLLFCVGAFLAWKKEYDQNRTGPQIVVEWNCGQGWNPDIATIRNVGPEIAFNVLIESATSWPEIAWNDSKEIQSITANGANASIEANLGEQTIEGANLHRRVRTLFHTSRFKGRNSIEIYISFSNVHSIRFTRTVILRRSLGSDNAIMAELGKLKVLGRVSDLRS